MKIHIFGASGAGATTTGKVLAEKLNLPYFDSDFYFWEQTRPPFTVRRDPAERNRLLETDTVRHPAWVLGGSLMGWHSMVIEQFTHAVFLWIPPDLRIERLKKRERERYGSIIDTDPVRKQQFVTFIDWATGYDRNATPGRTLQNHEEWMKTLPCNVLQLRGDLTTEARVERIIHAVFAGDNVVH